MKKNRNRAERRAGMSNPEAERRDYLFEHGDDRRKGGRHDGYGKNRYGERQDDGRNEYGKNWYDDRRGGKFEGRDSGRSRRNDRYGKGGKFDKRIHRKNENRIVRDERSEGTKRHERRMIAKYGNTEGPNRRHSKKNRNNAPFRMKSGRR